MVDTSLSALDISQQCNCRLVTILCPHLSCVSATVVHADVDSSLSDGGIGARVLAAGDVAQDDMDSAAGAKPSKQAAFGN